MYPPKVTDSLEEGIANLVLSLQRGGAHWGNEVQVADRGDGMTRFYIPLVDKVPESAKSDVVKFVRGYLKKSGWTVKGASLTARYLEIRVSNV